MRSPHQLVRASAGSGKTHRLALRYLEVLFAGADPATIVASTFTREASGEILGRVFTRLALASRSESEASSLRIDLGLSGLDRGRARVALRRLADSLPRLSVSTLDSLLYRIALSLRSELGLLVAPTMSAIDDPLASGLRERALEATLAELADAGWVELLDLFERFQGAAAGRSVARALDSAILDLYETYREAPYEELWGRMELPAELPPSELGAARQRLGEMLLASAPGALSGTLERDLQHVEAGNWSAFLSRGLGAKVADGETRYRRREIPPAWRQELETLVAVGSRELLQGSVARSRATFRFLASFDRSYAALRRHRGLLLFSDLASTLLGWFEMAGEEGVEEIYYRLDAKVGHLLLDEFQDTSLAQWSLLRPIADEIRAYGDGSRTFFCVGDPKQAIYGWRGGCADLFGQVEEDLRLDPAGTERMDTSFRSSQVILDTVNRVFSRLEYVRSLEEQRGVVDSWAAAFFEHRAERQSMPGWVEMKCSGGADPRVHGSWVAGRLGELQEMLAGASIAALVQTNEQVSNLLDCLRRAGVAASGLGGSPIAEDPAVAAILAALLFCDHPGDTVSAYHLLESPLGRSVGLGSLDSASRVEASRGMRREWWESGVVEAVAGWVRAIEECCSTRSRLRLSQLMEQVERFARGPARRPAELAAFLRTVKVESPRSGGVRVMTVHRAKGLEFDVVALPELDRPLIGALDSGVYLQRLSPLAPVEAVHRSVGRVVRRLSPELESAYDAERDRRLRDGLSALYVALTRARHGLLLWPRADLPGRKREASFVSFATILGQTLAPGGLDSGYQPETVLWQVGDLEAVRRSIAPSPEGAADQSPRAPATSRDAGRRSLSRGCEGCLGR